MFKMLIVAACVVFCNIASAQDYDDPAISVCEWSLKDGLPSGGAYTRKAANIAGSTVSIEFSISYLNTPPQERTHTCHFEPGRAGFRISTGVVPVDCTPYLTREMRHARQVMPLPRPDEDKIDHCVAQEQTATQGQRLDIDAEAALSGMGIYPIDPKSTRLKMN